MLRSIYYFVSDVHLGLRTADSSVVEKRFLSFLDGLPSNTKALYLLGDIFDFWYEYKYVIPRGYTRVLGKLTQLRDSGVEIYFFKGNHDMWTHSYFEEELGWKVLPQPYVVEIEGRYFCLGHGDGLGETPLGFRLLKKIFSNRIIQSLFSSLHPRWALAFGYNWSKNSRLANSRRGLVSQYEFKGEDGPIYKYAASYPTKVDYFVFGHFHTPIEMELPLGNKLFILGDWVNGGEYLKFDGEQIEIISASAHQIH